MFGINVRNGRSATRSKRGTWGQRWRPALELLEDRTTPAAVPTATISGVPAEVLLGETGTFSVAFDNTSPTDIGYGPYVNLYLPATGVDGAGAAVDDGITFVGATYLGATVNATVVTLTAAGVAHPFAKDATGSPGLITPPAGFREGDQLVVLEVPFGSFTPNQPPANIVVTAALSNLADANVPLPIRAEAGFRFGNDPLDNPTVDPSIIGSATTATTTPTLFRLTKTYIGPEDETTTGPNFPRQYQISVDIADGQTIDLLQLEDYLPSQLQFVAVTSTSGGAVTDVSTPSATTPGGVLIRQFASVTGGPGDVDAQMTFSFYAPRVGAGGADIIDPATGNDVSVADDAVAGGSWVPLDPRDPTTPVTSDVTNVDHTLTLKSIATQKSSAIAIDTGAPGLSPGDTIEYTIDFQISDYFAFQDLIVTDLFSDGQTYVSGSATLAAFDGHEFPGGTTGAFDPSNVALSVNVVGGSDRLLLGVSDELIRRGFSGQLVGGAIPTGGIGVGTFPPDSALPFGPTRGTITFRTVVQDAYEIDFPSGDPALNQGDPIGNSVSIAGDLLNVRFLNPNGNSEADTSASTNEIQSGSFTKTVYAINGVPNASPAPGIAPGDTVTYRLRYTLPTGDVENLVLRDFLPLPIFDVDTSGAITAFDDVVSAVAPVAGRAKFGPDDTFRALTGIVPAVGTDSTANSVTFTYGTYTDTANTPVTIDILFTVTVSNDPFADQLLLSNGAQVQSNNTVLESVSGEAIAQVVLQEPFLTITKGVVATDNPAGAFAPGTVGPVAFNAPGTTGARFTGTINSANLATNPINSNLSGVDQSDVVTFAIVIENTGSSPAGAFDVILRDTFPEGVLPTGVGAFGVNLRVTDGAGNVLSFTALAGGLGIAGGNGGITLVDPSAAQGAIGAGVVNGVQVTDGSNIVVITYDLITSNNRVNQLITDVATVENYAGQEGGPNFVPNGIRDDATVRITTPTVTKELVGTEIVNATNANNEAVIGELVTYRLRITVPEGTTPDAILVDTLDQELAFVSQTSFTLPSGVLLDGGSSTPTVTNTGRTITWGLGNLANTNASNATPEVIEFEYQVVVVNTAQANAGDRVNNSARLTYAGGTPVSVAAPNVTIIEPQVQISKSVDVDNTGTSTGDAGDPFVYTITLRNAPGANQFTADAFDLTFSDVFAAGLPNSPLENLSFAVTDTAGIVTDANFELVADPANGNRLVLRTVAGGSFDLPVDAARTITLTVTGNIDQKVQPGQLIPNDADVRWTSIDGDPGQRSTFNTASTERTGAGGINDYFGTDDADINILNLDLRKTIVTTSENATTDSSAVVIGEIVRYRVEIAIPEFGTATRFQFVDLLPAGMQPLDPGTARIAFVTDAGDNLVSSNLTDPDVNPPDLYLTGDETNVATLVPQFLLPLSLLTFTTVGGRTQITFDLGQVTNPSSPDNDREYVVVEFDAYVENVVGNQAGVRLVNQVTSVVGTTPVGTILSPELLVAEPNVFVQDKLVTSPNDPNLPAAGAYDAGDRVGYRVDFANAVGATVSTAYDVRLVDTPPTGKMVIDPASVSVFRNGTPLVTGFTNTTTATAVNVTLDAVAPGDVITVSYTVTLTSAVVAGEVIPNTANVTWTSLPGERGTLVNPTGAVTPGASGAANGERNGSNGPGGALNDYAGAIGTFISVLAPDLDKSVLDTSFAPTTSNQFNPALVDLTVGEFVTYRLTLTLPEGTSTLVLTDILPAMAVGTVVFTSAQVVSIGSNISGSALPVGAPGVVSGSTVSFNFGTVTNLPDNVVDAGDRIVVDVVGQVTDRAENVSGRQVTNTAVLDYGFGTVTDSATADIVEPALDIQKDVSPGTGDALDVFTYTLTVTHLPTSTAAATAVVIEDLLNTGNLELVAGSVGVSGPLGYLVANGNGVGDTTVRVVGADLFLGQTLTITYQARLTGAPVPGDTVPNSAVLRYSSLRQTAGSRAYTDQDPAAITVNSNSISGVVYTDNNDNGVYEPGAGETLITGTVALRLSGTDHLGTAVSVPLVTTTGTYSFAGLRPGTYTVTQVNQPTGFADGRDTPGTQFGGTGTLGATPRDADAITGITIPLGANPAAVSYNFGELPPASVGNFVWEDLDGNGVQDPLEPGLDGLTVTLTGANPDGSPVSLTTTTANGGMYSFGNLRQGTYALQFTTPAGYIFTLRDVGSDALDSDVVRATGQASVTLGIGETNNTIDAGAYESDSISGFVYRDFNINGLREPLAQNRETGIAGVTILLTGVDLLGNPVLPRTTTTNALGAYRFSQLQAGTYTITEVQPPSVFAAGQAGYYDGFDAVGTVNGGAQGTSPAKNQFQVTLNVGEVGANYNFGELVPADPFGFVYLDQNKNGVRDSGEPGIPGVAVTVSGTAFANSALARPLVAADLPSGSLTVFTDANGRWEFPVIPPGVYSFVETQPTGYLDGTEQNADTNPPTTVVVGNDRFDNVELEPFPIRGPFNFGEFLPEIPVRPVTPVLPPDVINKGMFLSSTPDAGAFMPISPQFTNSVASLGVVSPARSIGVAVGAGVGELGIVRLFDFRTATERVLALPFGDFRGGVRVAAGDVTGDGIDDLVAVMGPGGAPIVAVYDGSTGALASAFFALPPHMLTGLSVAVGDTNGDGRGEIVVGTATGLPIVAVYDVAGGLQSFFVALGGLPLGANVGAGDVTGDGRADIVVGAASVAPVVFVYDGINNGQIAAFLAFPPAVGTGVNVTVADTAGVGRGQVVATLASGPFPVVATFDQSGTMTAMFFAPVPTDAGLRVAAADINGDGAADLVLGAGGGSTRVGILSGRTLAPLDDFYGLLPFAVGGVFVG